MADNQQEKRDLIELQAEEKKLLEIQKQREKNGKKLTKLQEEKLKNVKAEIAYTKTLKKKEMLI